MLESHLMEETNNKWPKWQDVSVDIKMLSVPATGCIKAWKNMYKNRVERDVFETCTNEQSDKVCLLTSKFCPSLSEGYIHV